MNVSDEQQPRLESACGLYAVGKLAFPQATRWAGVSRREFEDALIARGLPLARPTLEDLRQDIETLSRLSDSC